MYDREIVQVYTQTLKTFIIALRKAKVAALTRNKRLENFTLSIPVDRTIRA